MTREKTKEAIRVMQAYVDGKKIEIYEKENNEWIELLLEPCWDWDSNRYRIAPNQEEPKEKHYRPYTMKEFVEEMHKHDGFVRNSISKHRYGLLIIDILDECVCIKDGNIIQYDILCEHYVWSDNGQPCGKEVAE